MPVLANQKVVKQLYDYPLRQGAGWGVFGTVTNTIHQSLHLFHNHHQKCAARRKHALSHELRQENQLTEWLKRKYMDTVRQQQPVSTRVESSSNSRGFDLVASSRPEMDHGQHVGAGAEQREQMSSKHASNKSMDSPSENTSKGPPVISAGTVVRIKKEVDSDDNLSSPSKMAPEIPAFDTASEVLDVKHGMTAAKSGMNKWGALNGEDSRDELKLTAYDVIAGVISTPPIKPLEQDIDSSHKASRNGVSLPASSSSKAGDGQITPPATITTSCASSSAPPIQQPPSGFKSDKQTLDQDLDEFSKVYDQVTQEQKAKERRHSLVNELEPAVYSQRPTRLLNTHSSYLSLGQPSCPLQHSSQDNYYQHLELQPPPPNRSQVNCAYQGKRIKPPLLPCVSRAESPPPASHIPATPTTPLEHFSEGFQSSSPLLALAPPHTPAQPPPPYSSTAVGYSAFNCDTAASTSKRWPVHSQPTLHSALSEQDNSKEAILAHVNSHIVPLAGQKRPIQEFNGTLPPTKVQIGLSSNLHGYHNSSLPLYPGQAAPAPSFTHHPL